MRFNAFRQENNLIFLFFCTKITAKEHICRILEKDMEQNKAGVVLPETEEEKRFRNEIKRYFDKDRVTAGLQNNDDAKMSNGGGGA